MIGNTHTHQHMSSRQAYTWATMWSNCMTNCWNMLPRVTHKYIIFFKGELGSIFSETEYYLLEDKLLPVL